MKFKNTISIFLAVIMIFGTVSISAEEFVQGGFPDIVGDPHYQAISYLKALGTLKGDGGTGNFRPDDQLSRQEFVVIISRLASSLDDNAGGTNQRLGDPIPGIDITVNQSPGGSSPPPPPPPSNSPTNVFTDVSVIAEWAMDSVSFVAEKGWVKGYGDGSFGPRKNLTHAEAITVLIRLLGYETTIDSTKWPASYISKAEEIGIIEGVSIHPSKPITRAEMAKITYNALFIPRQIIGAGESVNEKPIIRDLSNLETDTDFNYGDTLSLIIGDLDSDGYGDVLKVYRPFVSPTGEPIELWKYLQSIKEFEEDVPDPSDGNNSRVADLKKLADELVNVYSLAEEVIVIGAEGLDSLIGSQVRVTFNSSGQIFIIESMTDTNS